MASSWMLMMTPAAAATPQHGMSLVIKLANGCGDDDDDDGSQ